MPIKLWLSLIIIVFLIFLFLLIGNLGDNTKPLKRRTILCVDQNEYALPPEQCEEQPRPNDHEPCSLILPVCNADEKITDDIEVVDNEIPDTV